MAGPLSFKAGVRDSPLVAAGPVTLRVFRVEAAFSLAYFGCGFATAVPVGVLDRSAIPNRFTPIFDLSPLVRSLIVFIGLVALLRGMASSSRAVHQESSGKG
jgi:hypothetical protein